MDLIQRQHFTATDFSQREPVIHIVLPCHDAQDQVSEAATRLDHLMDRLKGAGLLAPASSVYFVDDASRDGSWDRIEALARDSDLFCGIRLAKRRGADAALLCGLMSVSGDAVLALDISMQDDLAALPEMIRAFRRGEDIVQAGPRGPGLAGRLLGRRVLEALRSHPAPLRVLRGQEALLGFGATTVDAAAKASEAPAATSWKADTSLLDQPLRLVTGLGLLVTAAGLLATLWALGQRLFTDQPLPHWASTTLPLYFLGGVQLLGLGAVGQYLAQLVDAARSRQPYRVERICGEWKAKR